jgi:RNA polymerase sigma-70 factor, ECF subfamily
MGMESLHRSFAKHYDAYADPLFRFCLWRVSDRETALDLVQDAFMRYWDVMASGKKIDGDRALLFTIARRLVIDHYRKKKTLSLDDALGDTDATDIPDPSSFDLFESAAEGRRALEAIQRLTSYSRQAVYLRFIEDLSPKEIAEVLDISPNAASVRIDRGLKELKGLLDPNQHGT